MGGCEQNPCIRETRKEKIQPYSGTRKSSRLFDRIDLYSEHSGIWSGASGDGGQSGGCRQLGRGWSLGCGRCCQRAGGLCSRRRHNCDHRGQLPSRPNTSSISSASTSSVIAIARQKHGMLSQSQQRLRLRHGSGPHCRSTGVAAAQDTFTASASWRPPCHRGNPPSGKVEKFLKGSLDSKVTQQCFALLPQVNFPANNLNFHWRWRWWDWIQAIFLYLFYFMYYYDC